MITDECVSPPELDNHLLLRYLDGERSAEVVEHLDRCPYCRSKSQQLAQMQNYLAKQLYRLECPTPIELGDYALGLMPRDQSITTAAHIRDCPHCTKELTQLKDYLRELSPNREPSPLEHARVIVARLVEGLQPGKLFAGPGLAPAYAALRGGSPEAITLQAEDVLIVLAAQPMAEGRLAVNGLVSTDDQDLWTNAKVELSMDSEPLALDNVSDIGAFHLDGIPQGAVEIKITPLNGPIILANIEIVA